MNAGVAALAGIRIIDMTTVVAGPSATQTLADYGAEVIKIEAPGGDTTRHTGPMVEPGMASLFLGSNRNKKSALLNLMDPDAVAALQCLCDGADVFIHNVRPQKLARLGISAEALRERNPRLIFVGLLGFGEEGPYTGRPAYDDIVQALSGVTDLNRRYMGDMRYMPTIVADKVAGQMAVHATLAALFQRERTGAGQIVEVPMFEAMVQFLLVEHFNARQLVDSGTEAPRAEELAYSRTVAPWRKPFATLDGYVCFLPYSDRDWRKFLAEVGCAEISDDPRFVTVAERTRNITALYEILAGILEGQTTAHWLSLGERLGIASARVQRLEDLERDPHLKQVGMFPTIPMGAWTMRAVRSPVRMGASRVDLGAPPRLGEHTAQVLRDAGVAEPIVTRLVQGTQ